jgi:amino acid permease
MSPLFPIDISITATMMFPNNHSQDGVERPLLADLSETNYEATTSEASGDAGNHGAFKRNLGAVEAFGIVISIVIGSGVFTSPGSIDANVPSPGTALVVWLIGGILAWTGATTMAELGTSIPGEGSHPCIDPVRENNQKLTVVIKAVCSRIFSIYSAIFSASSPRGPGSLQ